MADLRNGRKPGLLPLSRAQAGQAATCRRHSARGGRILAVPRKASRAAAGPATRKSGVAPVAVEWRFSRGGGFIAGHLRPATESGGGAWPPCDAGAGLVLP